MGDDLANVSIFLRFSCFFSFGGLQDSSFLFEKLLLGKENVEKALEEAKKDEEAKKEKEAECLGAKWMSLARFLGCFYLLELFKSKPF